MIRFEGVTKTYPDGTRAVDRLDLHVEQGELTVLVGPSGCGKTTVLRMVNRMIEPTDGTVLVDGMDVRAQPPAALRRRLGYVIQQVGLFPHHTVARNIATVPRLLGWDERRIAARVEELLALLGLPPGSADRYPHQLSGGQRQRVGVARALAAEPPVLLMDEPFGAVDPLVRGRLQAEFADLQRRLRKTVLFVTHDIDEAIRLGDRVAVFAGGGRLQQYTAPRDLLAAPANAFVADFLGAERGLRRLALIPVAESTAVQPGPVVRVGAPGADVRTAAQAHGSDWVVVVDDRGRLVGWVAAEGAGGLVAAADARAFRVTVSGADSLRAALDAIVTTELGVAAVVGTDGRYQGLLTRASIASALR